MRPSVRGSFRAALAVLEPDGYNAGSRGWNYDFYRVPGLAVVTGYRVPSTVGTYVPYTAAALQQIDDATRAALDGVLDYPARRGIAVSALHKLAAAVGVVG